MYLFLFKVMESKKIINLCLLGIILILLFVSLPVPVENMEGARDKDNYIHGGFYWTSISEQASYGNLIPLSLLLIPGLGLIGNNYRRKK